MYGSKQSVAFPFDILDNFLYLHEYFRSWVNSLLIMHFLQHFVADVSKHLFEAKLVQSRLSPLDSSSENYVMIYAVRVVQNSHF